MKEYFRGWYFKLQSPERTLALIPAEHRSGRCDSCSLQIIGESGVVGAVFPGDAFRLYRDRFGVDLLGSRFDESGIRLGLRTDRISAEGEIRFGRFTPIKYDIMGPFRFLPLMECRHSVISMRHRVDGELIVNGDSYQFSNAVGYIEGDRGRSFPRKYIWTQCCFEDGSLMLSAAEIPIGRFRFIGVIGIVWLHGREYRLASYLGARAEISDGCLGVRQGGYLLCARLIDRNPQPLSAPASGEMTRTIHESAACRAEYQFYTDRRELISFVSERASFESEW